MKNIFKKWFQNPDNSDGSEVKDQNGNSSDRERSEKRKTPQQNGEQVNDNQLASNSKNSNEPETPTTIDLKSSATISTPPPPPPPTQTVVVEQQQQQQQENNKTDMPSENVDNKPQEQQEQQEINQLQPPPPPPPQQQQQTTDQPTTTTTTTTDQSTNNLGDLTNQKSSSPSKTENPNKINANSSSPSSLSLKPHHQEQQSLSILGKLKLKLKGSKDKESAGDKKSLSQKNDGGQNGTNTPNGAQQVPHTPLHMQDEKVEREVIYINSLEELPEDCQKLMRVSGIPEEKFRANLQTLLYVLHFRTGKILKLHDEIPREPRKKFSSERFSDGESLLELLDPHQLKKIYRDSDQVGKGGFGTVYFAKSTRDKKTVAIKKMPHITKRQITQNLREASILSKCDHPNIVKLITCHIDKESNLWLIMEFMEGGTFEEAAKAWRFNENNLAYVARELLKGLKYLHENGMVHRDLKSANIMMSVEGKVKLIDFGLCEDISTGSPCHMVGSPFWMPPEMILQKPHSTPVDIWSFAISLLEMANQRPPMMESAVKAMFTVATEGATGFDHPDLWSDVFKDFLSLCLKVEPSERATAVDLLQHPFIKKADTRDNMENILKKIFLTNSLMNSGF